MTYSVITTYFRRTSRTKISVFVANQILFFKYKNYFAPILIKGEKQGTKKVKSSLLDLTKKDFSKINIFKDLSKTKRENLEKFIDLPLINKENLGENNFVLLGREKNKKEIKFKKDLILNKIREIINRMVERKKIENLKIKEYYDKNKNYLDPLEFK